MLLNKPRLSTAIGGKSIYMSTCYNDGATRWPPAPPATGHGDWYRCHHDSILRVYGLRNIGRIPEPEATQKHALVNSAVVIGLAYNIPGMFIVGVSDDTWSA